ncbi:MAG: response regulator [Bacteroidia bacterium]
MKHLLYVDDEEMNILIFSKVMNRHFDVTTATSGEEALNMIKKGDAHFDAVVSDLMMPNINGFQLLEMVKEVNPNLKRYIFTAYFKNEGLRSAIESGLAIGWFKKPLEEDVMKTRILEDLSN